MNAPEVEPVVVRSARLEDAPEVGRILAEAFIALYRATFGALRAGETERLLTALYQGGFLSLENTRLAVTNGRVTGLCILHVGESVGRGDALAFWQLLCAEVGLWRAPRAFVGAIGTNIYLGRRIPRAPDLVYIEALAVSPAARGRGIGTLLLADAEAWARAHGRGRLALHVLVRNRDARRLYERVGFRLWQEPGTPSRPSPWAALRMVRRLYSDAS